MSLSIGIVGLPNVGKSTLFNALTKAQNAEAANYPFCTIEPNKAIVPVPDKRLPILAEFVKPQRIVQATVDFIDIAGLVRGASKGEGLGNKFLASIRECAVILEVVRCFDDENITHVEGRIDPLQDVETIETELLIADIQSLERRIERLKKTRGDKTAAVLAEEAEKLLQHLNTGNAARTFAEKMSEALQDIVHELGLLTAKKIVYCANVDEEHLANPENLQHVQTLTALATERKAGFVVVCAKIEEELQNLDEAEQLEMLSSYGITESSLVQVIRTGYEALGLISYFTAGVKEIHAWTVHSGAKAPEAAGVIHTDFEKGFIRAEVIAYNDYIRVGSEAAARTAGVLRVEGKEYVVKDGDVVHFLFNV